MKKIFIILLLLTASLFGQGTGVTQTGSLFKKKSASVKESNPPILIMINPYLTEDSVFTTTEKKVTILGKISDESKISSLYINANNVVVSPTNEFSYFMDLAPGINPVNIVAADEHGNITKKSYKVNYNSDRLGPVITITEPVFIQGQEYFHRTENITIKGIAEDETGIQNILVNETKATVTQTKEFFAQVKLTEGKNMLLVKAFDMSGNITEKVLTINYSSDTDGPSLTILEPAVTRGSLIVSKKEVQIVKGLAFDRNGVKEVLVNSRPAAVNEKGEFTIDMLLNLGDNRIIVKAIDKNNNSTIDTFFITRKLEEIIAAGKYYALIIGIDKYKGTWAPLRNAVNDAKAVESLIKSEYKFDEIISMYDEDASRKNIIEKMELLSTTITKDDNLLIFYSGHGEYKQTLSKGFWVPADATTKSVAEYISNSDLQDFLAAIPSKHTLLVADACFSGDIFRGRTEEIPFEDSDKYFKEVHKRVSRAALTSGGNEPVTDGGRDGHSVFTYYFLKALKENQKKYMTTGQVFNELSVPVANNSEQTPIYMPISKTGDEGGQFIFIKKDQQK
ncbi:MAG: caspase family protein [Ignavibacteriaceae bacterium]|nr:caspase family protein [Ignavibacteriaceae bacterium]